MAKATTNDSDRGLIGYQTRTSNGTTTSIGPIPTKQVLEIAVSLPSGATGVIQISYDGGASWFALKPNDLAVVDGSSAAVADARNYYTEEPGILMSMVLTGSWTGTASIRVSGPAQGY